MNELDLYQLDPARRKTTIRSLIRYAMHEKQAIFLGLFLLVLAVGAELTGPYIAKVIIDEHIVAIEKDWVEVKSDGAVIYDGRQFAKAQDVSKSQIVQSVSIVQTTNGYFFVPKQVVSGGERKINGNTMTITRGDDVYTYDNIQKLTQGQVYDFYSKDLKAIGWLSLIYVLLLLAAAGLNWIQQILLQRSAHKIIKRMRLDVFTHLQQLPVRYFDQTPIGKIVSRVTNDTETIRDLYLGVLARVFSGIITMAGILVAMFFLDYRLGLVSLIIIPIVYFWIQLFQKLATKNNFKVRSLVADMNGQLNENIQTMPIIQAYAREKEVLAEFEQKNEENYQTRAKLLRLDALMSHNLSYFLKNLTLALLIWVVGGKSLTNGSFLSLGILYAYIDYVSRLFEPVTQIMNQLSPLQQALVSADRMFQLLDEKGEPVEQGRVARFKGAVTFKDVEFSYEAGNPVLREIQIDARPGATIALVGHTGSGKSSIMNLLMRFYDPSKGQLLIDGQDVTTLPKQAVREHMGIVLQDPFLFTGTIRSNITLGNPDISEERVRQAIEAVGADRFIDRLPNGLDEPVIEKGATLSAGERQLISFARALAFDPAILVLDEATASVDSETEAVIQDALLTLTKGRTTFIIAHRLSTIKDADEILVLDRGQIVERGSHDVLLATSGIYAKMYALQSKRNLELKSS
ncbi:multidrug ABC transporter permease [Exiguobacterium sp. U13-1]|uniref:ABC transporter ATP-binding protein/permease n=1 Tax=Exiguobacterium acetylicum TaxID=41170 RepID=A0ABX8GCJ6_EXIAC|nr:MULTISPECIES: ABC transporter ATP-binding protein [Exiguobacterium]AOS99811.1 multidrug ABC transporter permease [Exiguobacterium sp. U13-1]QWB30767.1 ABC transporter ATP-binding protein/permease [Exiguobacterium acetylicum]